MAKLPLAADLAGIVRHVLHQPRGVFFDVHAPFGAGNVTQERQHAVVLGEPAVLGVISWDSLRWSIPPWMTSDMF